jgi:hypothetical protein
VLGSIEANKAAELYSDTTFNYSSWSPVICQLGVTPRVR